MEPTTGDRTLLNEQGVSVSRTRFMVPGQTYAMSGITSVKSYKKSPNRIGPSLLGLLGLFGLAMGTNGLVGGITALAIAVAWWFLAKAKYSVLLSSASGEVKALTSKDGAFVSRVIDGLNEAVVQRG